MAIKIQKTDTGYIAKVTSPHGNYSNWSSDHPMTQDELIDELKKLGCHQTDIGDAFYEADPNWLNEKIRVI